MSFASRSGRWDMEDRRWGVVRSRYPISDLRSSAAEAALADRVREVGNYPDFSDRYGRAKWVIVQNEIYISPVKRSSDFWMW